MEYGLIGAQLPHSFSKEIHEAITGEEYVLKELAPEELDDFLRRAEFKAINVTIPYKQAVIPYLEKISPMAEKIGAVNCIVNRRGKLYGYNTDFSGLRSMILEQGLSLKGKTVLILGSGGTSRTAAAVAESLGAAVVQRISRSGNDGCLRYEEAMEQYGAAEILINTTPAGMYPRLEGQAVDLDAFPALEGVIDVVYNPLRTKLVQQARSRSVNACGGLFMLVSQAVSAVEIFRDLQLPEDTSRQIYQQLRRQRENLVLTGMPGCGKSTVGTLLAQQLQRKFIDLDQEIVARAGCDISDIFARQGEQAFRELESQVISELAGNTGCVIATGGGAVLRPENVRRLKQNGRLYFLDRSLEELLPTDDRPLAQDREALQQRYDERYPTYCVTADVHITVDGTAEDAAAAVRKEFGL